MFMLRSLRNWGLRFPHNYIMAAAGSALLIISLPMAGCGGGSGSTGSGILSPPSAPANVKVVAGDGQVTLTWNTVSGATRYDVCSARGTISSIENCSSVTGGTWHLNKTSPMTITNLVNGVRYYFRVMAKSDSGGFSAASSEVSTIPQSKVTNIDAGSNHSCAVVDGGVQCWGSNSYKMSNTYNTKPITIIKAGSGVSYVSVGKDYSCAIANGGVKCWGVRSEGEDIWVANVETMISENSNVTAVSASQEYACAVVSGGLRCWGTNEEGQLGDGTTKSRKYPVQVIAAGEGVTGVAAGSMHTCAVINGGVTCWGNNTYGQVGSPYTNPSVPYSYPRTFYPLQYGSGVTAISAGSLHTCALAQEKLKCWGDNSSGQLGKDTSVKFSASPVSVEVNATPITSVSAGSAHTCVTAQGGVKCWGMNGYGQLGNGTTKDTYLPQISIATNGSAVKVAAGWDHTCALVAGKIKCWGDNGSGELGDGTTIRRLTPINGPSFE